MHTQPAVDVSKGGEILEVVLSYWGGGMNSLGKGFAWVRLGVGGNCALKKYFFVITLYEAGNHIIRNNLIL